MVCRTGSKLGISPLMLAAMNGHGSAVKLLLDTGADINAQVCPSKLSLMKCSCCVVCLHFVRSRPTGILH